tara:strand:+ start:651 stop:851 length:201 start_codon:yes stop_codon:yes gene_type:complete
MYLLVVTNWVIMVLISVHLTVDSCNTAMTEFKKRNPGKYMIDCIKPTVYICDPETGECIIEEVTKL